MSKQIASDLIAPIAVMALGYLFLAGGRSREGGTSGEAGADIPAMIGLTGGGNVPDPSFQSPQPSQSLLDAMYQKYIEPTLAPTLSGSSLVAKKSTSSPYMQQLEKNTIQAAGFSTEGLQGSFDPSTGTLVTFGSSKKSTISEPKVTLGGGTVREAFPGSSQLKVEISAPKKSSSSSSSSSGSQNFSSQGGGNYSSVKKADYNRRERRRKG